MLFQQGCKCVFNRRAALISVTLFASLIGGPLLWCKLKCFLFWVGFGGVEIGFIRCLSFREKPDVVSPCCGLPLVLLRAGFLLLHVLVHADGE